MLSLVGLRAVDIAQAVTESAYTEIGSYNKPIAGIIPVIKDEYDLADWFFDMCKQLNIAEYTIIRRPKNKSELAKLFRELEKEIKDEI